MASIKLKSRIHKWRFYIRLYRNPSLTFVINCFVLFIAAVDFIANFDVQRPIYLIVLLFAVNILWQLISTISEARSIIKDEHYYHPIENPNEVKYSFKIEPECSKNYPDRAEWPQNTHLIYSKSINEDLRNPDIKFGIKETKKHRGKVDHYIKCYKSILINFFKVKVKSMRDGAFFNEKKLCMASELKKNEETRTYSVSLSQGEYYNTYLTNEIYTKRLSHTEMLDLYPPLNFRNYPIQDLEYSYFENHIGVSTIVRARGRIFLTHHNNQVAVYADKLQSTGSGSCDYADWNKKANPNDFKTCIITSAERELFEETHIGKHFKLKTTIIGYYRNLNRGGKPEFCCVTEIDENPEDIDAILTENKDELKTNFHKGNYVVEKSEDIDKIIANPNLQISTSLYMNLIFLKDYIKSNEAH